MSNFLQDNYIYIIGLLIAIFLIVNVCWECSRKVQENFQDSSIQTQIDEINKNLSHLTMISAGSPYSTASVALLVRYLIATGVLPNNFPVKPSEIINTLYTKANPNLNPKQIAEQLEPLGLQLQDSLYTKVSNVLDNEVSSLKPKSRLNIF